MLQDVEARLKATDPACSFIVQAPAGSGKTEILTQRYLCLLGTVKTPEHIVALTFTRKAAGEMRARVMTALRDAAKNTPLSSEHQKRTRDFAQNALHQSHSLGWDLLNQPARLKIMTLDALCHMICHAIPLHGQSIAYADILTQPSSLYEDAVRGCLQHMEQDEVWHPHLKELLLHLDNRLDRLKNLLVQLLSVREQWLEIIFGAKNQTREDFEAALLWIEQQTLQKFEEAIPFTCREELRDLTREFAQAIQGSDSALANWSTTHRQTGLDLATLLLTKEGKLRKGFDHHVGLKRDAVSKPLYDQLKARSKTLFETLQNSPDFLNALIRLKNLPPPLYNENQWKILQTLLDILPLLAAHLHLCFQEANGVDFTAISEQALDALGEEDNPTDLALHLDNAIHHLLIDEFQDTSIRQFQLLNKLVAGWQTGDGKTLFLVGDPMQSIYRFRQAEVGLFLKTRQEGLGSVQLTPLELSSNFRSTDRIISWVNFQFKTLFPAQDDIHLGAVSFHPSIGLRNAGKDSKIIAQSYPDRQTEAEGIVEIIVQEQKTWPDDTIAVLVRSRSQLTDIVKKLREKNIPFQGMEIEKLSALPHLKDIFSLLKALLMPSDRLAWCALLRSPYVGLGLADLLQIANFNRRQSIYETLSKLENLQDLSTDGRERLTFVFMVLSQALTCRQQQSLSDLLIQTISRLHGDKIFDETQRKDFEQFFILLAQHEKAGYIFDLDAFETEFENLYSKRVSSARLQIMTIHKSKGLEFDSVILPGLGNRSRIRETPLLRWLKLPDKDSTEKLLLSPLYPASNKKCGLYNYLSEIDAEKNHYEHQRLLYVAVTRAKKRLYLTDSSDDGVQGSFRGLLKLQNFEPFRQQNIYEQLKRKNPELAKLPLDHYIEKPANNLPDQAIIPFVPPSVAHITGVAAHKILQYLGKYHPENQAELPWHTIFDYFRTSGFSEDEAKHSMDSLQLQIKSMLEDPIGAWICRKHENEQTEFELLLRENNRPVTRIIDRLFYESNTWWIIDYKTGNPTEQAKHRLQVNQYAKLISTMYDKPTRCGLYYLQNNQWVTWSPEEPIIEIKSTNFAQLRVKKNSK